MRLFADACVAASLVRGLRDAGHDVLYASEGEPSVPDELILDRAEADGRILLTEDQGFGALTMRDRLPVRGVVLVELHGLGVQAKNARVAAALQEPEIEFEQMLTVVEPSRVRRRPLVPGG